MSISDSEIIRLYLEEGKSCATIAEEDGSYPKRIQRILKKAGVSLRTKSEAQSKAIETGTAIHPTKGKTLSEAARNNIGEKITAYYSGLTTDKKKEKSRKSKAAWDKRSDAELADMRAKAGKSYAHTSRNGSKIENDIAEHLREKYIVEQRVCGLIPNINLEVDIHLPEYRTIIEVDGPTHFLPIWGEESLQKHKKADTEKAGLLINFGFTLIRIKCFPKKVSATKLRLILAELDVELETIIKGNAKKHIELEIK